MSSKRGASKPEIRNYEHYKELARTGELNSSRGIPLTALQIDRKYDVGWLQLLAWMARYNKEMGFADG